MAQAIKQYHQGYRFLNPQVLIESKPNVYRRSLEARQTTDDFLLLAAGRDLDAEEREVKRRRAYKQAALILAAVGLIVAVWVL